MEEMFTFTVKIHAPELEPKIRHRTILESFDHLQPGEYLELSNDHDPKPLHYQMMMEKEGEFTWHYLDRGPDIWRVAIGKV